ncbi:methionine aminopeptidase 2B [Rosa chinensis]|uniref:methionine aminopeptidase 2B n=1 Tax=Rosa chinensis TaxID=74649 RepID=UPI001AD8A853|nr:methionine aminopeptidase 2B [Rosa chinensis]
MWSHRNPQGNTNRQAGGSKGFAKTQKVFVPKNQGQNRPRSPKSPNSTLSASLRQSLSQPSNAEVSSATASAPPESSSSSSRVRMGERGEWVSTKGNFVNYLPQDEAVSASLGADEGGLDAVESQRVVDLLNRELSRLLKLNPKEFWKQDVSKKKKKNKSKKKKSQAEHTDPQSLSGQTDPQSTTRQTAPQSTSRQTDPPSIPLIDLFPHGEFPEGEIQQYRDDNLWRTTSEEKRELESLEKLLYNSVRRAAEVRRQVRKYIRGILKPGMLMTDLCETLENTVCKLISENGLEAGIAFPTGCSMNWSLELMCVFVMLVLQSKKSWNHMRLK